jgi:catechol 2,3-dioxygenase
MQTRLDFGIQPDGYRLPAATRLGCVRLQISDLGRSLVYYESVLGLLVLSREQDRAALGPHGARDPLIELREDTGTTRVPRQGRLGLYHYAVLLPDRAALGRFLAHLAASGVRAATADHAVSESVYLWDPDGLGIEVYADRPRATWRRQGRELHMTTEPLDIESVRAAAGGEPWAGVPEGTVMGHVHLHVGDLARAEAFYHRAIGFDKVVWSYPGALFLSAGGYHHHLGTNIWAAGAPAAGPGEARLLEWEIVVPTPGDAHAVARSCEARGFAVHPTATGSLIADPWGTTLRLVAVQETR